MFPVSEQVRRIVLPVLTFLLMLTLWQVATTFRWINPLSLPAPARIFQVGVGRFDVLLTHILMTIYETLSTFLLTSLGGILVGALLMQCRAFRLSTYPTIVMFQLLPKIALAPLFVVWFGVNIVSRLTFAGFIAFFPIVIATLTGLRSTDPLMLKLCRSVKATPAQIFWHVRIPYAVPFIMSGLKVGMTLSITGVIIAEFITVQSGLGYIVLLASYNFQIALMYAALILIGLVGLLLYGLVLVLERIVLRILGVPITATFAAPGEVA
jgi:NitT/TauT family transport system permease protein